MVMVIAIIVNLFIMGLTLTQGTQVFDALSTGYSVFHVYRHNLT